MCQATGWGVTSEDGFFLAANLQKVSLPLVSDETCYETYQYLMRDNMVCAGEEGKDGCQVSPGDNHVNKSKSVDLTILTWPIAFVNKRRKSPTSRS